MEGAVQAAVDCSAEESSGCAGASLGWWWCIRSGPAAAAVGWWWWWRWWWGWCTCGAGALAR